MAVKLKLIAFFLISFLFVSKSLYSKDVIEKIKCGYINWSYYSMTVYGESFNNFLGYQNTYDKKISIRLARIEAFKNLYHSVLNLPIIDNKPLKELLSKEKKKTLFQKIYKNAYVLGWMEKNENMVEVSIKLDLLKILSDCFQSFIKNIPTKNISVYIIDARNFDIKPAFICNIYNLSKIKIYSFYPKYVDSMEEALLLAGPRKIMFLNIVDIINTRCSFVVDSNLTQINNVILITKNEENF